MGSHEALHAAAVRCGGCRAVGTAGPPAIWVTIDATGWLTYRRSMTDDADPRWLVQLRADSTQRPRTQFRRIRWAHLQLLLRDFDTLWDAATPETRARVQAARPDPDTVRYVN